MVDATKNDFLSIRQFSFSQSYGVAASPPVSEIRLKIEKRMPLNNVKLPTSFLLRRFSWRVFKIVF